MKGYKCGYCGQPTTGLGRVLSLDEINAQSDKWTDEELVHGDCCSNQAQHEEESRIVTREMAMDAGDPSLEGSQY